MGICNQLRLAAATRTRVISTETGRHLATGAIVVFFCVVAVAWLWAGEADGSAHYVTGLVVRYYIVTRAPLPPVQFSRGGELHLLKEVRVWPVRRCR